MELSELLSIENADLLKYKFPKTGMLIWPFIRYNILSTILEKQNNYETPHSSKRKMGFISLMLYLRDTYRYSPFRIKGEFPILFITTALDCTFKINGKYVNRVHDYFVMQYPQSSMVLESSKRGEYILPRIIPNYASYDYLNIKAAIKTRIRVLGANKVPTDINRFVDDISKKFGKYLSSKELKNIKKMLVVLDYRIYYMRKFCQKLIDKIEPKVIFINCASYGGLTACLIKTAKENGIKVGEFQHGLINIQHVAYNFSNEICNYADFKDYLPDYLLTYSNKLINGIQNPSKIIAVGNPHLITMIEKYKPTGLSSSNNRLTILIVSQGTLSRVFVDLAYRLANKFDKYKDYKIIFRLHPGEVPFKERYSILLDKHNIEISKEGDIFKLISDADIIVACFSTTIFEALSFGKPVFILDNETSRMHIPSDIGIWFHDYDELYQLIRQWQKENDHKESSTRYIFERNWQANYEKFLKNEIGLELVPNKYMWEYCQGKT
jgi:hypothetical protein